MLTAGGRSGLALTLVLFSLAATCGRREKDSRGDAALATRRVTIGGLSLSLPVGYTRASYEESREPQLDIPGQSVDQVFASWAGPGEQRLHLFYWSTYPPRDLGPMVAARRWKVTIAGREAEVAETTMFMGLPQRVLVTWLERPGGAGRFMIYARNLPRETFEAILATMSF